MIINGLDLGGSHPFVAPEAGNQVATQVIESAYVLVYNQAGDVDRMRVTFWAKAWQGIGGQAAGTTAALDYLLRQGVELSKNRDLNPVYVQWTATADPSAALNVASKYDGWWIVERFKPDYTKIISGLVPVELTVVKSASAAPTRQGVWYAGGTLATTYAGAAAGAVGLPVNAVGPNGSVTRTGGEGSAPAVNLAVAGGSLNPLPFSPSSTIGDWFKGGCRVYDTLNTTSNPVPTSGAFVHANWVEVLSADHAFVGDCVITNGLHLYLLQAGQARVLRGYVWSTGLATVGWQQFADLLYQDNAASTGTLRGYSLQRVGLEEVRVLTSSSTSGGNWAEVGVRLQRGQYFGRVDFRPLSQANSSAGAMLLTTPGGYQGKIAYTESAVVDIPVANAALASTATYGYGAELMASASFPFIYGWLYQNAPASQINPASSGSLYLSDTSGPTQNAVRSYGFFAIPYGLAGNNTPVNLQAEAESPWQNVGAAWVSVVDAAASGGNAEKLPATSAAGKTIDFGPHNTFTPAAGTYRVWFRIKVTSAASSTAELRIRLVKGDASSELVGANVAPNNVSTAWTWIAVGNVTMDGATTACFQADNTGFAAAVTDWFVDEAVMVPLTLSSDNRGPQELWAQFLHDRRAQIVRY